MIFIVLITLGVLATVAVMVYMFLDDGLGGALLFGAISAIVSAFVGGVIFFAGFASWMMPGYSLTGQNTYSLSALGTDEQIAGRTYFLGGGYIGERRVLNYIREGDEGGYYVKVVPADDAVIYQDSDDPEVTIYYWEQRNWWLAPWAWSNTFTAEFHVPEGSVLSDYTVSNGGGS